MRKSVFFLFLLSICLQVRSQMTTYYSCDFQSDATYVPSDMTLYDLDGLTPTADLAKPKGPFEIGGRPWIVLALTSTDTNFFAGSTSSYVEKGAANDWMVTPAIAIYGKGAELSWKGLIPDNSPKRDGYEVRISTKGVAVEDFDEAPVFTIAEESAEAWTEHKVNLDKYAGKVIYVAFINNSTDKYVLGIDDILVTGPEPAVAVTGLNGYYTDQAGTTVKGKITNLVDEPITSFTACYGVGDAKYSKEFTDVNLKKGESLEFEFDQKLALEVGQKQNYFIWVEADGSPLATEALELTRLTFLPQQRVVIEEATGIWCGNCTRGMAIMNFMKNKYPNNFIGIAVHGTDSNDPMADSYYGQSLGLNMYPTGMVNRKYTLNPLEILDNSQGEDFIYTSLIGKNGNWGFEYGLLNELSLGTYASVEVEGKILDVDKLKISFDVESTFGMDIEDADYRFAIVLIENNVQNNSYHQENYMNGYPGSWETSDGIEKGVGGYESQPATIKGKEMVYHEVARGIVGDFKGIANSIKATSIQAGQTVKFSNIIDLSTVDTGIMDPRNLELIAMLIDQKTGAIVNANIFNIGPTEISSTLQKGFNVSVSGGQNGCNVAVTSDSSQEVTVELLDVNGKILASSREWVEGDRNFSLVSHAPKGIYIVRVSAGEQVIVRKIAL